MLAETAALSDFTPFFMGRKTFLSADFSTSQKVQIPPVLLKRARKEVRS